MDKDCICLQPHTHRRKCDQHERAVGKSDNELYAKILSEASIDGESNEEFDARALQISLSSEFEEDIEDEAVEKSAKNKCKVTVGNLW